MSRRFTSLFQDAIFVLRHYQARCLFSAIRLISILVLIVPTQGFIAPVQAAPPDSG